MGAIAIKVARRDGGDYYRFEYAPPSLRECEPAAADKQGEHACIARGLHIGPYLQTGEPNARMKPIDGPKQTQ